MTKTTATAETPVGATPKKVSEHKYIRNRNNYKVEISVDGVTKALAPHETIKVPKSYATPTGIGVVEV